MAKKIKQFMLFQIEIDEDKNTFVVRVSEMSKNWKFFPKDLSDQIEAKVQEIMNLGYVQE